VKVGRPHGLDGSFYVDGPVDEGATVRIGDDVYTVAARKGTDAKPIIRLNGIDNRDDAEALRGQTLSPTSDEQPATSNDISLHLYTYETQPSPEDGFPSP